MAEVERAAVAEVEQAAVAELCGWRCADLWRRAAADQDVDRRRERRDIEDINHPGGVYRWCAFIRQGFEQGATAVPVKMWPPSGNGMRASPKKASC